MAAIDPDILATLTDEEREAIAEGITESEKEALAALADEGDGEDGDDDGDNEGTASAGAAPIEGKGAANTAVVVDADAKPPAKSVADEADPADSAAADDGQAEAKFKPKYEATLPEDFDAQVKAVQDEGKDLAQKFKGGDIDFDEFEAKRAELDAKRDSLRELKVKADISSEMSAQSAQQEWTFTVRSFVKQVAKSESIDYAKDEAKRNDLDMFVKSLGADEKNADKDMQWFLDEAHKRVKALHGLGRQEAPPAGDKPKKDKPTRKSPIDSAPKTLAQVPGGDGPGDVGDEFADLDSLDGYALERAISKMTPAQREQYSQGA